ncbi:MAG: EthD family reductase [Alphaproteobacteria bacterium]|nr:EthD family reductase [Alphaproteobacteria bacterium]
MYVRCGFFEGEVASEDRARFDAFWEEIALPLARRLPGIRSARILRGRQYEPDAPRFYQVVELSFGSLADIEAALASPVRAEIRARYAEFAPLFKGRLTHINCEVCADTDGR